MLRSESRPIVRAFKRTVSLTPGQCEKHELACLDLVSRQEVSRFRWASAQLLTPLNGNT